MAKSVPDYLERQVLEGRGDVAAQRTELALCQIEATEAQTDVLERIATSLEQLVKHGVRPELPGGLDDDPPYPLDETEGAG